MIQTLTTAQARDRFSAILKEASYGDKRTVITNHGERVAAIVPMSDLELLHELELRFDIDEALQALKEANKSGTTPLDELKEELGL